MNETAEKSIRQSARNHRWLQSLRLMPDFVTHGVKGEVRLLAEEEALLGPLNLAGAELLEVGAQNGHFSMAALRRGAASVLATDHLAWSLPGAQAQAAAQLAAGALGLELPTLTLDPRALSAQFGSFHVVLATGFFEQLFNPIMALRGLRSVTSRVLLLETMQDALDEARPMLRAHTQAMPFGGPEGTLVSGYAPNPPLVLHLLHGLGFDRILYRNHPTLGAARGMYAALLPDAPEGLLIGFGEPWINLTHPTG